MGYQHGGRRKGAGRQPDPSAKDWTQLRVSKPTRELVRSLAERDGLTQDDALHILLKKELASALHGA